MDSEQVTQKMLSLLNKYSQEFCFHIFTKLMGLLTMVPNCFFFLGVFYDLDVFFDWITIFKFHDLFKDFKVEGLKGVPLPQGQLRQHSSLVKERNGGGRSER